MSELQSRARVQAALDLLTLESDSCQLDLQSRVAGGLQHGMIGPIGIGSTLALSRRVDTLERITRELSQMLDERPVGPAPALAVVPPPAA
jgi:hypothetical protein